MTALRDDPAPLTVALVTLGCARNDVDSEELAGRLEAGGFRLVEEPADAARGLTAASPVSMPTFAAPKTPHSAKNFSLTSALIGAV